MVKRAPPRWVVHPVYVRRQGVGFGDPGAPNSPASAASRYFLAPQARIWRFSRPRWPISRQNGTPGLSTGKIKVVGNRELSRSPHSNSALLDGKGVQLTQASKRPQLVSHMWGCSYGPVQEPSHTQEGTRICSSDFCALHLGLHGQASTRPSQSLSRESPFANSPRLACSRPTAASP